MIQKKKTKDIYLAAAYMVLGAKLENVDRTDPRHQEFTFSLDKCKVGFEAVITTGRDLDAFEMDWANATLTVNAVKYKEALQRMKALVHSQ